MADPGRAVAVEELLAQSGWMRALARRLVGEERAEDLAQEALAAALRRPPRIDVPLRAWLAGTLRRLALSWGRGDAHRRQREERAAREAAARTVETPVELLERVDVQRRLAAALLALDEPFRHTVLQRYFEGRSSAEIARASGTPEGTVRWRLKRGLDALRARLDEDHEQGRDGWVRALAPLLAPPPAATPAGLPPALALGLPALLLAALAAALFGPWRGARSGDGARALTPAGGAPAAAAAAPADPAAGGGAAPRAAAARGAARAARVELAARAVDADGRPLPRAALARVDGPPASSAPADADGRLTLALAGDALAPGAMLELALTAPGHVPRTVRARWRGEPRVELGALALAPAAALAGVVLAPDGAPAPGAEVLLEPLPGRFDLGRLETLPLREWSYLGSMLPPGAPTARAAGAGRYAFEAVPVGYVRVWARGPGAFAACSEPLALRAGARVEAPPLRLVAPADDEWIAGEVVDPDGGPVPGAALRAWRATRPELALADDERAYLGQADARGRFRLPVNPNPVLEVQAADPRGAWLPSPPLRARAGERDLRLALRAPASVAVRVADARGAPADGATVRALDAASGVELARAPCGRDGAARLALPARAYLLEAAAPGARTRRAGPFEPTPDAPPVALALEDAPRVQGVVTRGGAPLGGAQVELLRRVPDGGWRHVGGLALGPPLGCRVAAEGLAARVATDAAGRFALALAEDAPHLLRVSAPGSAPAVLELGGDGAPALTIELDAGGALEGEVAGDAEHPAAGALVGVTADDGLLRVARCDAAGAFRLAALRPGPVQVRLFERDLSTAEERALLLAPAGPRERTTAAAPQFEATVRAGETARVTLERAALAGPRLRGELLFDGGPPGPWRVELTPLDGDDRAPRAATLDPRGRFALELARPGRYALAAWLPQHGLPRLVLEDALEVPAAGARWSAALDTGEVALAPGAPPGELRWRGAGALRARARASDAERAAGALLRAPAGTVELALEGAAPLALELAPGARLEPAAPGPR